MISFSRFRKLFQQIQVVRPPKHRLSTFGASSIEYMLVTDVPSFHDRARLRIGTVTAERPSLITMKSFQERFSGFGAEAIEYSKWLTSQYGDALRGIEYQFIKEPEMTKVELVTPQFLVQKLATEIDRSSQPRQALIFGADKIWELAVMKFIVEETMASFSSNLQELTDRGFFEGEDRPTNIRKREIETLFSRAQTDKSTIPVLGKKLKEYNLFDSYQDRFFQLLRS